MLYKRKRIVKKHVVIYDIPKDYKMMVVKGNLWYKKFVFIRFSGNYFSCMGCILQGRCNGIALIPNDYIMKFCRHQSKFFGINIYYRCYEEAEIYT